MAITLKALQDRQILSILTEQEIVQLRDRPKLECYDRIYSPMEVCYRTLNSNQQEPYSSVLFFGELTPGERARIIGKPFILTEHLPCGKGRGGIVVPNKQFLLVTFSAKDIEFSFDKFDKRWLRP